MANAKKCDICEKFYVVPDVEPGYDWNEQLNTSMVRVLRLNRNQKGCHHEVMQFDACDDCLQDVLDYILAKKADKILHNSLMKEENQ